MDAIICYWKWEPVENRGWHLLESFPIDADGHCLKIPSTGGGDRQEWNKWMNQLEDDDWVPIMGRAVTIWDYESGVGLLDIHPPEWPEFLSPIFYERLCKMQDWFILLENGHNLYFGTVKEVKNYVSPIP